MMNPRILIGFALAFSIGVICRLAGVPLPAPPAIIGALLVVAMTVGYLITDRYAAHRTHTQAPNHGGPTGHHPSKTH